MIFLDIIFIRSRRSLIPRHHFYLRYMMESIFAMLSPKARMFVATKQIKRHDVIYSIDTHHAGLNVPRNPFRPYFVFRENVCAKSIHRLVGKQDSLFLGTELNDV